MWRTFGWSQAASRPPDLRALVAWDFVSRVLAPTPVLDFTIVPAGDYQPRYVSTETFSTGSLGQDLG